LVRDRSCFLELVKLTDLVRDAEANHAPEFLSCLLFSLGQGFESRGTDPKLSTAYKWQRALEAAGVEFIDEDAERGPGVRQQKGRPAGKRK
jgi:hypothetical protein